MALARNDIVYSRTPTFPKAQGYNIRVGNVWYRTVAGPDVEIQIGTRDSLAQRQDQAGSIYENVLDLGYAWARTDLSGGEGLDWSPRELALERDQAALDQIRYWDSNGVDVSRPEVNGERYTVRLSTIFEDWVGAVTDPRDIATSQDFIYVADGDLVRWYESWTNPSSIGSATPQTSQAVIAMAASPNDTLMVTTASGNVYAKLSSSGSFTLVYDATTKVEAVGVWFVKGRFVVSCFDGTDEAQLIVIDWTGTTWATEVIVDTAPAPFWSVVESGPAVVAACGDGTVRTYTPDNTTGGTYNLEPRSRIDMPVGEIPTLLGSNAGTLLITTSADIESTDERYIRLYQAEVLDARFDYSVGQIQMRRQWLTYGEDASVRRNMANTRDEIFFFVKEDFDGGFSETLWRFDLVTNGLTRMLSEGDVAYESLAVFNDALGTVDGDNAILRVQNKDKYQSVGWLVFPNITFGLNTDISWIATVMEVANLATGGAQVELWRTVNETAINDWQHLSWVLVQRFSSPGLSGTEIPLVGIKSRTIALQVRIFPHSVGMETPEVTRVAIRGIPTHRDTVMVVPFNVSDYISAPGRKPNHIPGLGHTLHNEVLNLVGANVEVELLNPAIVFRGVVNNVSEPVEYQSERGSVTRYCLVEFRGQRVSAALSATGDSGMGLGLLGVSLIGVGQS